MLLVSSHCNLFCFPFFFFTHTATPEIYTLSLHDALPISTFSGRAPRWRNVSMILLLRSPTVAWPRSEEHTSELQSRVDIVCRLLLEKKTWMNTMLKTRMVAARIHGARFLLHGASNFFAAI